MVISTYLSVNTLNISGLNTIIKTNSMVEWIKRKKKSHSYTAYEGYTSE